MSPIARATTAPAACAAAIMSAWLFSTFCRSGALPTLPFRLSVSQFRLPTSCFWCTWSVIVMAPWAMALRVVALSLLLSCCISIGMAPPVGLPPFLL
ncbi:hypothetical protein ACFSUI_04335 [Ralstonia solanacearum]